MPRKSRHGKGKYSFQSKRNKGKQHPSATAAQQQVVAPTNKPIAPSKPSAPHVSVPTSRATLTTAQYPYIVAELRGIGILAGIILVILIVLALVLS